MDEANNRFAQAADPRGGIDRMRATAQVNAPSDTIDGMINLLNQPLAQMYDMMVRLQNLADRLVGPRPPEAVGGNGEIREEPHSMVMRLAGKHQHFQTACQSLGREIERIEQAL